MITFFGVLVVILILLAVFTIYWYVTIPKNLPPGPRGIPLFGSALEFVQPSDQHLILMDMVKKYGSIFQFYCGSRLIVVLGDYESIHEALVKQGDVFAGRPKFKAMIPEKLLDKGLIMNDGEIWKEHRRFALSTLRDFGIGRPIIEPRIKEEIDHLAERLQPFAESGASFDVQPLLTCAVSNVISQLVFGKRFDYDDREVVDLFDLFTKRVAGTSIGFFSPFVSVEWLFNLAMWMPGVKNQIKRIQSETEAFCDFVQREMDRVTATYDKSEEPTNYIHAYMKAAEENQSETFTNEQLLASAHDLFMAGTETTSTTTRYAILLLAHHPQVQERMFQEIKDKVGVDSLPDYADRTKLPYCEAVVMESQRVANLTPFGVGRRTLAKTKLMGYDIPEDTWVTTFLTNALHNEETFEDPKAFKPERLLGDDGKVVKEPKLIPFSAGKRICLGEALARMELFLLLVGLISRFRFYFPDDEPKPTLKPLVGILTAPVSYRICVEKRTT